MVRIVFHEVHLLPLAVVLTGKAGVLRESFLTQ